MAYFTFILCSVIVLSGLASCQVNLPQAQVNQANNEAISLNFDRRYSGYYQQPPQPQYNNYAYQNQQQQSQFNNQQQQPMYYQSGRNSRQQPQGNPFNSRFPSPLNRRARKYHKPTFIFEENPEIEANGDFNNAPIIESNVPYRGECGFRPAQLRHFIARGKAADEFNWPWHVRITIQDYNNSRSETACGGTLISPNWILTASHCYDDSPDFDRAPATRLVFKSRDGERDEYFDAKAKSVWLNPDYIPAMSASRARRLNVQPGPFNDIALIEVENLPRNLREQLMPACLASDAQYSNIDTTECKIMGHGFTSPSSEIQQHQPSDLQIADVQIAPNQACRDEISSDSIKAKITSDTLCVKGPVQPCVGDSGGPLVCRGHLNQNDRNLNDDDESLYWHLMGVVSFAVSTDPEDKCGMFKSAIFVEVVKYKDWITKIQQSRN